MMYVVPGVHCSIKVVDEKRCELSWFTKDRRKWAIQLSIVKGLQGRWWDTERKCWCVPPETAGLLGMAGWHLSEPGKNGKAALIKPPSTKHNPAIPPTYWEYAEAPEVVPDYVPEERQKALIDSVDLINTEDIIPGLRDYQIDFVKFAGINNGRVALLDDMGTGKTLQSLAWLAYAHSFPALIVVNAPTKLQWKAEYKRWLKLVPGCPTRVNVLHGKSIYCVEAGTSCIINWDILHYWEKSLMKMGFRCIIGDEVQAIGNPTSKRAKSFIKLSKKIPQCILMSGTPARSKTMQFWTMLHCINPDKFSNYKAFCYRYCDPKLTNYGITMDGISNGKELHATIVENSLRRTKDQVMKFLPSKTVSVVPVETDEREMETYREEEGCSNFEGNQMDQENALANLMRTAYNAKKKSCIDWIKNFLDTSGEKLVVFAWHVSVVDDLVNELQEYHPAKIYGGTSAQEREAAKKSFIEDENCRVIIGNIQSLGTGVDGLQKSCCNVAFVEFATTSTDMDQATDRLHRGGQERPVTAYYLVADGTIDNEIVEALDFKRKNITAAIDGKEVESDSLIATILERRKKGESL